MRISGLPLPPRCCLITAAFAASAALARGLLSPKKAAELAASLTAPAVRDAAQGEVSAWRSHAHQLFLESWRPTLPAEPHCQLIIKTLTGRIFIVRANPQWSAANLKFGGCMAGQGASQGSAAVCRGGRLPRRVRRPRLLELDLARQGVHGVPLAAAQQP